MPLGRGDREPLLPGQISTSSSTGRSSSANSARGSARPAPAGPVCMALRPRRTTRSTCTSRSCAQIVMSTPSPSPPARSTTRATADSGRPKKRRIRWSGLLAASSTRWTARSRVPAPTTAGARPAAGNTTTTLPSTSSTRPGAVPASPRDSAPSRDRRLLPNAGLELLVRTPKPLREPTDDAADLALERRIEDELAAGDPGQRLQVRSSCVGPSPPEVTTRPAPSARETPLRARPAGRPRRGLARARSRACSARGPGTARSRPCARRGRARSSDEDDRCREAQAGSEPE